MPNLGGEDRTTKRHAGDAHVPSRLDPFVDDLS
jgi:hypothetical protein